MFLLASKFKLIGMLLIMKVVHGHAGPKTLTKTCKHVNI